MDSGLAAHLEVLFAPQIEQAFKLLGEERRRLVHYTSADAGLKIINGAQVWMRHASVMNDFSEIEHGAQCLASAWRSDAGKAFQAWLDSLFPGFSERVANRFDRDQVQLKNDTYLTSVSVHKDEEDDLGRLSMWRAYGGNNGVALVMNADAFLSETDVLGVFSAPVTYVDTSEFVQRFAAWAEKLYQSTDLLKAAGPDEIEAYLIQTFRLFLLCTKHPGFHEEEEWRVFHTPAFDGGEGKAVQRSFESISGVPQPIMKIPLSGDLGVPGLAPRDLINRVIIGPSENAFPIYLAYTHALGQAGVERPHERVAVSNIPLRT